MSVRLVNSLHPAGLDAGEVEQCVHQLEQPQTVTVNDGEQFPVVGQNAALGLRQDVLERAEHQGQRGAELVADIGEEERLGAVDLGQELGPPPLLFVSAGVGNRRGDVPRDGVIEVLISLVQQASGADGSDQEGRPPALARCDDRGEQGPSEAVPPNRRRAGLGGASYRPVPPDSRTRPYATATATPPPDSFARGTSSGLAAVPSSMPAAPARRAVFRSASTR